MLFGFELKKKKIIFKSFFFFCSHNKCFIKEIADTRTTRRCCGNICICNMPGIRV